MLLLAGLISHANRYHLESPASVGMISPNMDVSQEPAQSSQQQAYDEADLQAQQSMALAAWFAVAVSGTGLVGLLFTVRYALFAWKAAQKSADADEAALVQARLATVAAYKNEKTAREIGQKQSMAYLYATGASIAPWPFRNALSGLPEEHHCVLHLSNIGQTMAKRVEIYYCFGIDTQVAAAHPKILQKPFKISFSNVAPSQTADAKVYKVLTPWKKLIAKESATATIIGTKDYFHFWGEIHYSDVFDVRHRSAFQFVTVYNRIDTGDMISLSAHLPIFEKLEQQHDD